MSAGDNAIGNSPTFMSQNVNGYNYPNRSSFVLGFNDILYALS